MSIKYSVLMLTYNRLEAVKACLDSLTATLVRDDVETIILDNGSTEGVADFLCSQPWPSNVRIVLNKANLGVAGGRDELLKHAIGEYIVFLDSDVIIHDPVWIDVIGAALDNEAVGMVGPGGSILAADWSRFMPGAPGQCDVIAGYCQAFKRQLLAYGLHIEADKYPGFWVEDSSFSLQVRQLGFDVLCIAVPVEHRPAHSGIGQSRELLDKHFAIFRDDWKGKGLVRCEGAF